MIRTQIQLTEEQARRLKREAHRQGVSMAEMVRRCVDYGLSAVERGDRYARAAGLVGAFRDPAGARRVAEEHDRYLSDESG